MKHAFFFLLLALLPVFSPAQTTAKYAPLDSKDPLVGEWEWVKDPIGAPYSPVPDEQWQFLRLSAGTVQSLGALTFSQDKGYGCPSYFIAYSNGTHMTGTISDTCIPGNKGKKFTFEYSYDATTDQLVITMNGETYNYKRRS